MRGEGEVKLCIRERGSDHSGLAVMPIMEVPYSGVYPHVHVHAVQILFS